MDEKVRERLKAGESMRQNLSIPAQYRYDEYGVIIGGIAQEGTTIIPDVVEALQDPDLQESAVQVLVKMVERHELYRHAARTALEANLHHIQGWLRQRVEIVFKEYPR